MKILVTALLVIAGAIPLQADELDWKLESPVTVEKADYYWDGGSVAVVLRGNDGAQRFVFLVRPEATHEEGGETLIFKYAKEAEPVRVSPRSNEAKRLLRLLRSACEHTFGTSDDSALKNKKEGVTKNKGFASLAMGSLLRQFDHESTKPNNH